jgi:protein-S-isoprenylcysteine O-methyltransferase Ste14
MNTPPTSSKLIIKGTLRSLFGLLLIGVLLFPAAGTFAYWQAWLYLLISAILLTLMATVLSPNKELIEERLKPGQGMKSWDKLYFTLSTPMYFIALILAGLDQRFGWSAMPVWICLLGFAIYLLGQAIFLWARYTNAYFSSVVRIQSERGHQVCSDGPYRYVRHPGYVGGMLFAVALPVALGSWWGAIPQLIAAGLMVWRTANEDRTLQAELPGYQEFTHKTKYRLLPGVW